METNKSEGAEHRYAVDVKLLDRFYQLYVDGKKKGAPKGYVEYFEIQRFLLLEVEKAVAHQRQQAVAEFAREILEETERLSTMHYQRIPWVLQSHVRTMIQAAVQKRGIELDQDKQ